SDAFGRKGIARFREVAALAARQWGDFCVILIGPKWDELQRDLASAGVRTRHFEFTRSEQTAGIYPLMDALLVTSIEEGGPCTVLEAMACGIPSVTSDVGHVPEVVENGRTGFVCNSVSDYLESLLQLRHAPQLARRMGAEARAFILKERDERLALSRID